jgi:hypothetical protein
MAMKIWESDPNNKPAAREEYSDDSAGTFSIGRMGEDGKPESLDTFRMVTASPATAEAIALLLGGSVTELETDKDAYLEVITARNLVPVIVASPAGLYSDLKLWSKANKLVHHCDGDTFLSPDEKKGRPCGCPELFAERKAAARDGVGPSPSIELTFRLAEDPELGEFKFRTGSWTLAATLYQVEEKFDNIGQREALAELTLEFVEFTIKKGPDKGVKVSYYKPGIKVVKAYGEAIADDRFAPTH